MLEWVHAIQKVGGSGQLLRTVGGQAHKAQTMAEVINLLALWRAGISADPCTNLGRRALLQQCQDGTKQADIP